jgi:flavodoxin
MKKIALLSIFSLIVGGNISCFAESGAGKPQKILIAYFTWSGNTKIAAQEIQKSVGGTLFEIKPANVYPKDFQKCIDAAKEEKEKNARPALSSKVKDIDSYDVIFVGYPNWWGTIPMPIASFLEQYDLSGKIIIPFCTHGSGGAGKSFEDIKKLCSKSKILDGFSINGSKVKDAQKDIEKWIEKMELQK